MNVADPPTLEHLLAGVVGRPVTIDVLKHKPGRRLTVRAAGPHGTAIAKAYTSQRASAVAARIAALGDGPAEPVMPCVLLVDNATRVLILTDVPGRPLADLIPTDQPTICRQAGAAVGSWHRTWYGRPPAALQPHTIDCEIDILRQRAANAPSPIAEHVRRMLPSLDSPWPQTTAVHRDLYEAHIVIDQHVGLIDLDDAACGPPELDIGNLLAHLRLLAHRLDVNLDDSIAAIIDGYNSTGPHLDPDRLHQCEQLSLLRLACIHTDPSLLNKH